MEVERKKRGRSWRIRPKRSREKGCRIRRRKGHITRRRDKEKRRWGRLSRRKKTEAAEEGSVGDGQAGTEESAGELQPEEEDEKERAGTDEQGKGERREPEPESLEGQRAPKQRESGAGDLPGPEGEGPRATSSTVPEEEKREGAEQKEREGEQPRGSGGAAEQQEGQTVASPDRQEEDRVAAVLSGAKGGQTAGAKPGSPRDTQGEREEELVPAGQQEQLRAEGLEPLKELEEVKPGEAVQGLKEEEAEEDRVEGGFSECQEGAGDIDESTTGDPREIEMRQNGAGKFNSKILLNHDGGIVQEQVIPDIKGAGED